MMARLQRYSGNAARHQRVVDVMNVLQVIGWTRVGFVDEDRVPEAAR